MLTLAQRFFFINIWYPNSLIQFRNIYKIAISKVSSVQEACAKCFAVHLLKFEILQITWKKRSKKHQNAQIYWWKTESKSVWGFMHSVPSENFQPIMLSVQISWKYVMNIFVQKKFTTLCKLSWSWLTKSLDSEMRCSAFWNGQAQTAAYYARGYSCAALLAPQRPQQALL